MKHPIPLLFPLFLLAACASSPTRGTIAAAYTTERQRIGARLQDASVVQAASGNVTLRNQLLNEVILLIDINYYDIERSLHGRKSWTDFGGSVAVLGLNAVGSATGAGEVSRAMNLISGLVVGTKAAFDRDVLQNQTILAVVAKMRASRATARLALTKGMEMDIGTYPLSAGIVDLGTYHNAGTFTAALQELVAAAGAQQVKAENTLAIARGLGAGVED